jgi:hypothetical protein
MQAWSAGISVCILWPTANNFAHHGRQLDQCFEQTLEQIRITDSDQ